MSDVPIAAVPEEDIHNRPLRLDVLEGAKGLSFLQKLQLLPIKFIGGGWPNPHLVLSYKRDLFGRWFAAFTQRSMRESDFWPKEELELFAAYTANQLNCDY